MSKTTLLVNLYGAPGAGKSSGAAYIFYRLKQEGVNCEIVTEFAKDKVWEGSDEVFKDGVYIFGKQHFKINRLLGKVDVIVTDSPMLISAYYAPPEFRDELISIAKKSFTKSQVNYFVNRIKAYNPKGRFQTEAESDQVAVDMLRFLKENDIKTVFVNGYEHDYEYIVDNIITNVLPDLNQTEQ